MDLLKKMELEIEDHYIINNDRCLLRFIAWLERFLDPLLAVHLNNFRWTKFELIYIRLKKKEKKMEIGIDDNCEWFVTI